MKHCGTHRVVENVPPPHVGASSCMKVMGDTCSTRACNQPGVWQEVFKLERQLACICLRMTSKISWVARLGVMRPFCSSSMSGTTVLKNVSA